MPILENTNMSGTTAADDSSDDNCDACCSSARTLRDDTTADAVEIFAALGNDTRYEALRLVDTRGEVCVCEVESALAVSQGTASQALSELSGAGLVDRRREGRWRYYAATPRAQRLLDVVDETNTLSETECC